MSIILLWLKHYWYIPLIIFAIVTIFLFTRSKNTKLLGVIEAQRDAYKQERKVLERIQAEKEEKKKNILKEYEKTIRQIEDEYIIKKENLHKRDKQRIKRIIEEYREDPAGLSSRLAREFGLKKI